VPNAAEQAVIARIKRERVAGRSLGAIAAGLNTEVVKGKRTKIRPRRREASLRQCVAPKKDETQPRGWR
jgi:hypothetical protein